MSFWNLVPVPSVNVAAYISCTVYTDEMDIDLPTKGTEYVAELTSLCDFLQLKRLLKICEQFNQFKKVVADLIPETTLHADYSTLLMDKDLCDITFTVGEDQVKAHKVVLASRFTSICCHCNSHSTRCKYFRTMFTSGLKEAQE